MSYVPGTSTSGDRSPDRPTRTVTDARGTVWRVYELDTTRTPAARAARCLVFDAGHVMRRVWEYPAEWRTLPDAALAALCRE